jgi:hypothetical protein
VETDYRVVTPGYFATLGIPIRRGRAFDPSDQHHAVISESLARKYWHGEDPIGKLIQVRGESLEIIGICGDTHLRPEPNGAQQVDLWNSEDPLALGHAVKGVVHHMGGVVGARTADALATISSQSECWSWINISRAGWLVCR